MKRPKQSKSDYSRLDRNTKQKLDISFWERLETKKTVIRQ